MTYDEIDITDSKLHGAALVTEITDRVKATQLFIIRPLPNRLTMRKDQYDDLQHDPDMHGDYESGHVFVTTENAMDVDIVGE